MLARWGTLLITSTVASALVSMPHRVFGQSNDAVPPIKGNRVWVSLGLGAAAAESLPNAGQLLGADLSVWLAQDKLALGIRAAAASRVFDTGDVHDVAVLAGIHPHTEPHVDVTAALGLGLSGSHTTGPSNLHGVPVIAAGAQLIFDNRLGGIGLDAFGGLGHNQRYYGIGLALALGSFR